MLSNESGAMFRCKPKEEFISLPLLIWLFANRIELQIFFFSFLVTAHNTNKLICQRHSVTWKMRVGMACNARGLVCSGIVCSNKLNEFQFYFSKTFYSIALYYYLYVMLIDPPIHPCKHSFIPQIHPFCHFPFFNPII